MSRRKIGGSIIKRVDLESILSDYKNYDGILFKIPNAISHTGVELEVYGAEVSNNGITHGDKIPCDIGSCSIEKEFERDDTNEFEFEHRSEFSNFNDDEPFIAFFNRPQIEMLLSLGDFEKAFISSFMPVSSNPLVDEDKLEPNFSLEIQPLDVPDTNGKVGFGLPRTLRAAGCPRTWTP